VWCFAFRGRLQVARPVRFEPTEKRIPEHETPNTPSGKSNRCNGPADRALASSLDLPGCEAVIARFLGEIGTTGRGILI
jgi:hypothetical protein